MPFELQVNWHCVAFVCVYWGEVSVVYRALHFLGVYLLVVGVCVCASSGLKPVHSERVCDAGGQADALGHTNTAERLA